MRSQSWLPKDRHVRQLLCADPRCRTCNTTLLEIQQLLECESRQISPTSPELPQDSDCLEMSLSSLSFEQHLEHCPRYSTDISWPPVTPTLTQLSEYITQSTSAVSIQEYWADPLQVGQEFQLADMPMLPDTVASSRPEECMVLVNEDVMTQNNPNIVQGNQNLQVHFQSPNPEVTNLTHPIALAVVPTDHLSFLSPQVLTLLELHLKKLAHFQRWGLPRRVQDSLRQLMPNSPVYYQSRSSQTVSFIPRNTSQICVHRLGDISHQIWCSYTTSQPTQAFWVSEWSIIDSNQRKHCQQMPNSMAIALLSPSLKALSGLCPLPGGQTDASRSNLQKKYSQLFCGLPSLHSESLVATFLGSHRFSKNKNISKLSSKDPHLLKELSFFPLLSKTPPNSAATTSPPSLKGELPHEHRGAQISVPFLTLAECEALEWHVHQKQLQLQCGLPAVFPESQHAQSHMQYAAGDKAQTPGTVKTSWPGKTFSVLPEPARRQLEFHLQRQLIHLRWGLPQRIQQSIQLFLSSTDQKPLTWSCTALPHTGISQPGKQEADEANEWFSPTVTQMSTPMPHLFAGAKAILQNPVDTRCEQLHQGNVSAYDQSSWEDRIPGGLEVAPLPYIPQVQPLDAMPKTLDHEQRTLPDAVTEHCRRPQALSEETIEKLETTLRHKYLTFLSGLPAGYHVALSRDTSPAAAIQSEITETVPIQDPQEPLTQVSSLDDPRERPGPCVQDDSKAHPDTEEELQPEVQGGGMMEEVPVENQTPPACPYLFNTHIMAKLNFHMKKKILEIQLGVPGRAREFKQPTAEERKSMQESLGSRNNQGEMVLQKLPIPLNTLPILDAKWVHFKQQLNSELKAVHNNQKQLDSKTTPDGSDHWASEQLSTDMTEAQVLCVQVEASRSNLNLKEPWAPEPQGPGKRKDSAHDPTLAEKSEDPERPKAAGDLGEGETRPHAGGQRPDKTFLSRTPHSSWQQKQSFYCVDPWPYDPQQTPQLQLPEPPPRVPGGEESECDMNDSQTKLTVLPEPARIPENALPSVPQASKGHPFFGHPTQGKLLQRQTVQGRVLQRPVMPASPHKRPSLPESAWREKMKSFLHSINPKVKGKGHVESTVSAAGKVARTRKENVDKSPAPAKSLMAKTKPEKPRGPKGQNAPTEKPVGPAFLTGIHSSNNEIRLRSGLRGSASVPGYPRHCPRHCPRMAYITHLRSLP